MSERSLQEYFKREANKAGIFWRKIEFTNRRGCPDVFCAVKGKIVLCEIKNPNKKGKLSTIQTATIRRLRDAGVTVHVIDSREKVDAIIRGLTGA
jgi:hypothetical protein